MRGAAARPRLRRPRDDRATRRPSRPRSRSTCPRCRGPSPPPGRPRWPRRRSSRWATAVRRTGRCGSSARGSTSTATGARSAGSPPTCARWRRRPPGGVDGDAARDRAPARLFAGQDGRRPARSPPRRRCCARFAVVAGGPGTGKTTTVARIVALLAEQAAAAGAPAPLVALAAPTGKAAARLEEAVHDEARGLDVARAGPRAAARAAGGSTLHRLLGWRPGSHSRFRHHRGNRLPHDVVIVDETSMVSLSLMARLVEAVRPDARLILVGDPGQLTSIEAGAVLGDIVGPATRGLRMRPAARAALAAATGAPVPATDPPETSGDRRRDRRARPRPPLRRAGSRALADGDPRAATPTRALAVLARGAGGRDVDRRDDAGRGRRPPRRCAPAPSPPGARRWPPRPRGRRRAPRSPRSARSACSAPTGAARTASRPGCARVEGWLAAELAGFGADGRWYAAGRCS